MPKPETAPAPAASGPSELGTRIASLDVYRGLVMFLMLAEALRTCQVARALPESSVWRTLCLHQSHVEWVGCTLHDLIQPSFSFLVGVALPFSVANRLAKGQSAVRMTAHAFLRALLLVFLGVFLRSNGRMETNFAFEDTLSQIGLGYGFLFLLGFGSLRVHLAALGAILVGYWALFATWPLPGEGFSWASVGVKDDWPHQLTGFAAHWNKNTNPAAAFDQWFLNRFPRPEPFTFNSGGYATLSFIPTLGTMILGLIAGNWLRAGDPRLKFLIAALVGLGAGSILDASGVCPNVKRIWTPAWVLFSGGWCFAFLLAFHQLVDRNRVSFYPLMVIGMNSIAVYVMNALCKGFIQDALRRHVPARVFAYFGDVYQPFVFGAAVLLTFWLILFWMHRRKIFIRI